MKKAREESCLHEVQILQKSPVWCEQAEAAGYNQGAGPAVITHAMIFRIIVMA